MTPLHVQNAALCFQRSLAYRAEMLIVHSAQQRLQKAPPSCSPPLLCRAAKRWRRAFGWAPCALGSLPSASDPNGRPAPRDLPPPPAHSNVEGRDTLEQRLVAAPEAQATAALPAAARQEAQDTGAEDVLVPAGEAWAAEQAEAAGVEEAGQAEWPLPDGRLAWALAAAAAGHEGGVEAEQGAGAAAEAPRRVSFPPLQLLL